jgi:hypothetical protein
LTETDVGRAGGGEAVAGLAGANPVAWVVFCSSCALLAAAVGVPDRAAVVVGVTGARVAREGSVTVVRTGARSAVMDVGKADVDGWATGGGAADGWVIDGWATDGWDIDGWAADGWVIDGWTTNGWVIGGWATDGWATDGWVSDGWATDGWVIDGWATDGWAIDGWATDCWVTDGWATDGGAVGVPDRAAVVVGVTGARVAREGSVTFRRIFNGYCARGRGARSFSSYV